MKLNSFRVQSQLMNPVESKGERRRKKCRSLAQRSVIGCQTPSSRFLPIDWSLVHEASITVFIKPRRTTAAKREREKSGSNVRYPVHQPEEVVFVSTFDISHERSFDQLKIDHSLRSIILFIERIFSSSDRCFKL